MSSISGTTDLGPSIDSQAALDGLSDEQLAALSAACEAEQARRVEASRRAGADGPSAEERRQLEVMTRQVSSGAASSALGAIGVEGKAAVAAEQGCAVHELSTIEARLEFARAHGLAFDEGVQDTLEEDLDASGIPERYTPVRVGVGLILTRARSPEQPEPEPEPEPEPRYALAPPPGFTPYPQQKPGTSYFPSDRDAVYVVSEGKFGSYACP